ncbi:MAG: hypothetical protein ACRC6H_08180 [Culicoidibacterales bacterium]
MGKEQITKILVTIVPIIVGMILAYVISFPKGGFYGKDMSGSILLIFMTNLIICAIVLYANKTIATIVYIYNLVFIGVILYIMFFIMNEKIYYYAPIEIFTLIYTYTYGRNANKKIQIIFIASLLLIAAILEGVISYV